MSRESNKILIAQCIIVIAMMIIAAYPLIRLSDDFPNTVEDVCKRSHGIRYGNACLINSVTVTKEK